MRSLFRFCIDSGNNRKCCIQVGDKPSGIEKKITHFDVERERVKEKVNERCWHRHIVTLYFYVQTQMFIYCPGIFDTRFNDISCIHIKVNSFLYMNINGIVTVYVFVQETEKSRKNCRVVCLFIIYYLFQGHCHALKCNLTALETTLK